MYFQRFRDSFAEAMDRRPALRGIALCLALLPLSCAQQLVDGSAVPDMGTTVDAGLDPTDLGDPAARVAPADDVGFPGEDDVPSVDPPDVGAPDDVATAPEDLGAPIDLGGPEDTGPVDSGAPVDLGGPVDTGPADTGPRCAAPLSECGAGPC